MASTTATAPSPTSEHAPENTAVALSSPALRNEGSLHTRYTCDGANTSPPLRWSGVPSDTKELALFLVNLKPFHGKLFADWAVLGLPPVYHDLAAGRLPAEAIVGRNGYGQIRYSLCPLTRTPERYIFVMYALPRQLSPHPGFDAAALRELAYHTAKSEGFLTVSYTRR